MRNPFFPTATRIAIPLLPTAALSGGGNLGTIRNRNHDPLSARIETATGLVTRIATRVAMGIVTGPKRETSDMVQSGPANALLGAETMMVSAAVLTSVNNHAGMIVLSMITKQSRGAALAPVHCVATGGCALLITNLCCPNPCRIPRLYLHLLDYPPTLSLPGYLSTITNAHFLPWNWGRRMLIPFLL